MTSWPPLPLGVVDYDSFIFSTELHMESLREVGLYYSPFSLVSDLKQQQLLLAVFED